MLLGSDQLQQALERLGMHDDQPDARTEIARLEARQRRDQARIEELRPKVRKLTDGALGLARSLAKTEARLVDERRELQEQVVKTTGGIHAVTDLRRLYLQGNGDAQHVQAVARLHNTAEDALRDLFGSWERAADAAELVLEPLAVAQARAFASLGSRRAGEGISASAQEARTRAKLRKLADKAQPTPAEWRWIRRRLRAAAGLEEEDGRTTLAQLEEDVHLLKQAVSQARVAVEQGRLPAWPSTTAAPVALSERPSATAEASEDALLQFAYEVFAAAKNSPTGRRDLGGDKVFINHAWRQWVREGGKADLDTFKGWLVLAQRAGMLHLARADLVEDMDPRDVAESETGRVTARMHFIRTDHRPDERRSR